MEEITQYQDDLIRLFSRYGLQLGQGIMFLIIGNYIGNKLTKLIKVQIKKKSTNHSLIDFITSLTNIALKVIIFIGAIDMAGVETTSFVAMLGSAGLAIGLALQGSLANIAGGALLLTLRPFKKGDLIEANGHLGNVIEIGLFSTTIRTPRMRQVFLPNGGLAGGVIKNFSSEDLSRVDLPIGISYGANIKEARRVLMDVLNRDKRIIKQDGLPAVVVTNLGESSVDLEVRAFVSVNDYWDFRFETLEACKIALDQNDIEIPFPQRVLHLQSEKESLPLELQEY
ncbi:mechanosensitive ion channel family protein [Flammeovirga agarivorans]|uniref:Mechanosensitive ion channel n=1 Tax=Flammeovirga agarivorans TaxID=2726742 RepID=A0A7X8SP54_9BACT|nr:mechanosensitive ion channel domain-containing protein [Flammeovirga agarivorans]NLR93730.1 mechanosensitive ion channel [Flammeovirga agarivorans]